MTNLILIGFRGVGKTAVGEGLARQVGAPFIDTDHLLEKRYRCSIPAMLVKVGWEFFRKLEREEIEGLCPTAKSVIAVGGGAVIESENGETLRRLGRILWLDADVETLISRLEQGNRPPLTDLPLAEEVKSRYGWRRPLYQALASQRVDTTRPLHEVVRELEQIWRTL